MNKVLEALLVIYNSQDIMGGCDDFWKAFRVIEKAIKALEIIKEKQVDIIWCGGLPPTLQNTYAITQEEIDILKEVLT